MPALSSKALPFASWQFVLPFPPSVNHYWKHTRRGRTYVSPEGVKFRKAAMRAIKERPNTRRRLAVKIKLIEPNRLRRDTDNYFKGVLDALAHAKVYHDDSQIDDLRVVWGGVCPPGSCIVGVVEIGFAGTRVIS